MVAVAGVTAFGPPPINLGQDEENDRTHGATAHDPGFPPSRP